MTITSELSVDRRRLVVKFLSQHNKMGLRLLVFLLSLSITYSLKHALDITDDSRSIFKIETFGFNGGGVLGVSFRDFSVKHPDGEAVKVKAKEGLKAGFLLRRMPSESAAQQDLEEMIEKDLCIFDVKDPQNDFFIDASGENYGKLDDIVDEEHAGLYTLIFQRCSPKDTTFPPHKVSFHLEAEFRNPGSGKKGSMRWNYLSAGDAPLPTMYAVFFILFSGCLVLWLHVLNRDPAEYGSPSKIHYLMAALLLLKVLTLLSESIRYHYISIYGEAKAWDDVYFFFAALKGLALFVTVALIGTGWSVVKSFLNLNEKKLIFSVLILQIITNVARVVVEETSPGSMKWLEWRDLFHLVDILCCLAILLPTIWSIKHLREAAEVDGKAQATLQKLRIFRSFYVVVIMYIYITRILVYLLAATVPYNFLWLGAFATEAITLFFYVFTGWHFQPHRENAYLAVREGDDLATLTGKTAEELEYGLTEDVDEMELPTFFGGTMGSSRPEAT